MWIPWFGRGRPPRGDANDRLTRLRNVLKQAQVGFDPDQPELALKSLTISDPPAHQPAPKLQFFRSPLPAPAKIALLQGGFHSSSNLVDIEGTDHSRLKHFAPEALALPLQTALSLADQKLRGLFDLPSLQTALIVFTSIGDTLLEDHHRDLLWRAFQVPVFEQLRGWDGTVIARECEIHDGLHVDDGAAIFEVLEEELLVTQLAVLEVPIIRCRTGMSCEIVRARCECEAETSRLKSLGIRTRLPVAADAARSEQ